MKGTYDVVGSGDGISGLVASALLAGKGFSCLWADTSGKEQGRPVQENISSLITRAFWEQGLKIIFGSLDTSIIEMIRPRRIQLMQSLLPGKRLDINPEDQYPNLALPKKMQKRYLSLLGKTMAKPAALARPPLGIIPALEPWEKNFITGLGRTGNVDYRSYLRYMTSLTGMYAFDYGKIKEALGSYLANTKGDYECATDTEYQRQGREITGVNLDGKTIKARYYLTESLFEQVTPDGFMFYGKCELAKEAIPVGMGDLLVVSPTKDMDHPIVLSVDRRSHRAMITVATKIRVDSTLTSLMEQFSWASGMILKRLRQVIPFMDDFLVNFDAVQPFDNNAIQPWFGYKENIRSPWLFCSGRYIRQGEKEYVCERTRFSWLDVEGEILWGICVANAILNELNRSDLIIKKMV